LTYRVSAARYIRPTDFLEEDRALEKKRADGVASLAGPLALFWGALQKPETLNCCWMKGLPPVEAAL
jgi:hypothetical protein